MGEDHVMPGEEAFWYILMMIYEDLWVDINNQLILSNDDLWWFMMYDDLWLDINTKPVKS